MSTKVIVRKVIVLELSTETALQLTALLKRFDRMPSADKTSIMAPDACRELSRLEAELTGTLNKELG